LNNEPSQMGPMQSHSVVRVRGNRTAFGQPGTAPRWSPGSKDGVGTAYAASSRLWFTLWNGIVTEVYFPTIDRPQLRDLQYLVSDDRTFFHEEKRDLVVSSVERLSKHTLGYRVTTTDPERRYAITKEIVSDPHLPCLLQHTQFTGDETWLSRLHLYALCAPRMGGAGWGNHAYVVEAAGRQMLAAEKDGVWLVMAATIPFARLSCGYVGASDGWTDLADNFRMDWEFDVARDGHVALTGELDLAKGRDFTLALAFGESQHTALTTLLDALAVPFEAHAARYAEQWARPGRRNRPLETAATDGGNLYCASVGLLLAHEDKTCPGALIASLSIPWGEAKGDEDQGGYHLVWTRDMVQSATALLAGGQMRTPLSALIYLAATQQQDGTFAQNFFIHGEPYWRGIQLDQVAFPVLLAWQLRRQDALLGFDPYTMVMRAATYLVCHGPVTEQERWEEASGYSPSTLASNIAALLCAASFAQARGDDATSRFLEQYADFLEDHLESWTVTTEGTLVAGIPRHYIRILPADVHDPASDENPNQAILTLRNHPLGHRVDFPAKEIVDAGFLELVRYGIRSPDDPLVVDSLRVVDAVLKVETPFGPCWHRYNHDGYGQRDDGGPYQGWGTGRAWPLLTGERGHYELAAGRDPAVFIRTMERFASSTGLLPEQVWDEPDRPERRLYHGRPTGSAMPLMWAQGEYIKLLRSKMDGQVFDMIPEVAARYRGASRTRERMEIWRPNRQVRRVARGSTLRVQAPDAFRLRWSDDQWQTVRDTIASSTALGVAFVDVSIGREQQAPIVFTFLWTAGDRWEGRDYEVVVG
jgi:glucoamylase